MKKKILFFGILILFSFFIFLPVFFINRIADRKIFPSEEIPSQKIGIVFGASVYANKYPSRALDDRIKTASELYKKEKIAFLLMSGDNSQVNYNEVLVMQKSAIAYGVPEEKIFMDHAGFRTYDSCVRAKEVFQISSAILITQEFHLPRAIFLCEKAGISVNGVPAQNNFSYDFQTVLWWNVREFSAKVFSFYEASFFWHPPKYLGEKVFID